MTTMTAAAGSAVAVAAGRLADLGDVRVDGRQMGITFTGWRGRKTTLILEYRGGVAWRAWWGGGRGAWLLMGMVEADPTDPDAVVRAAREAFEAYGPRMS